MSAGGLHDHQLHYYDDFYYDDYHNNVHNHLYNFHHDNHSIALQQAALSHILNAEGEKLQKVLSFDDIAPQTILLTNKSVESMVNTIANLETILKSKLDLFSDCICGDGN